MNREEAIALIRKGAVGIREWNRCQIYGAAHTELSDADLSNLDLRRANFRKVCLRGANLSNSDLRHVSFFRANMREANLENSLACYGDFRDADLRGARVCGADFRNVNLRSTDLVATDISGAYFGYTTIASNLKETVGLGLVVHTGPSELSVRSARTVPRDVAEVFFRGVGLRDEDIRHLASPHVTHGWHSCFISYSTDDEEFVARLYGDLQATGIRCWKWNHDARTGRDMWGEVDNAIRLHDKIILIASKHSLVSPYVIREMERAFQLEDRLQRLRATKNYQGDCHVLYPVAIDGHVFRGWDHPRQLDVAQKVVLDARDWREPNVYCRVIEHLVSDLCIT